MKATTNWAILRWRFWFEPRDKQFHYLCVQAVVTQSLSNLITCVQAVVTQSLSNLITCVSKLLLPSHCPIWLPVCPIWLPVCPSCCYPVIVQSDYLCVQSDYLCVQAVVTQSLSNLITCVSKLLLPSHCPIWLPVCPSCCYPVIVQSDYLCVQSDYLCVQAVGTQSLSNLITCVSNLITCVSKLLLPSHCPIWSPVCPIWLPVCPSCWYPVIVQSVLTGNTSAAWRSMRLYNRLHLLKKMAFSIAWWTDYSFQTSCTFSVCSCCAKCMCLCLSEAKMKEHRWFIFQN